MIVYKKSSLSFVWSRENKFSEPVRREKEFGSITAYPRDIDPDLFSGWLTVLLTNVTEWVDPKPSFVLVRNYSSFILGWWS